MAGIGTEGYDTKTHFVENPPNPPPASRSVARKTRIPENFAISDQVRQWATEHGHDRLEQHLAYFTDYAAANGKTYANWDAAFKNAIRGNWAKLPSLQNAVGFKSEADVWLERERAAGRAGGEDESLFTNAEGRTFEHE